MPKNKSKPRMKKPTVAWRIKPEVMALLEEAQRITGSDRTEIIEQCIKGAIDEVINKEVERKKAEAKRADEELKKYKSQS